MFFELPWVGVAKDAMAVAISIKYSVCQNAHFTFYLPTPANRPPTPGISPKWVDRLFFELW